MGNWRMDYVNQWRARNRGPWQSSVVKKRETRNALHDLREANAVRPRVPQKWERQYRQLCLLRERLLGDRQELIEDSRYPVGVDGIHMADLASDEFERDLDLSLLSAEENALFEVEEAMRRIEHGSYGVCEITGKSIPLARLRAIPWTRFTAEAELSLEKLGAVDKAHLGKLRRVETEPVALSRELERILPPEAESPPQPMEKLAESIERTNEEERASRTGENNESD